MLRVFFFVSGFRESSVFVLALLVKKTRVVRSFGFLSGFRGLFLVAKVAGVLLWKAKGGWLGV